MQAHLSSAFKKCFPLRSWRLERPQGVGGSNMFSARRARHPFPGNRPRAPILKYRIRAGQAAGETFPTSSERSEQPARHSSLFDECSGAVKSLFSASPRLKRVFEQPAPHLSLVDRSRGGERFKKHSLAPPASGGFVAVYLPITYEASESLIPARRLSL